MKLLSDKLELSDIFQAKCILKGKGHAGSLGSGTGEMHCESLVGRGDCNMSGSARGYNTA